MASNGGVTVCVAPKNKRVHVVVPRKAEVVLDDYLFSILSCSECLSVGITEFIGYLCLR